MIKYVVKRFAQMIVVLFIVSLLVFLLTNFIGDPVDMLVPENATLEQIESARARLGLDKPFQFSMVFLSEMCFTAILVNLIYMENLPWI